MLSVGRRTRQFGFFREIISSQQALENTYSSQETPSKLLIAQGLDFEPIRFLLGC
jgi:hypothetical protein